MKDNDVLQRFGEYTVKLAGLLKEGHRPDSDERIFIENNLLIVQAGNGDVETLSEKKSSQVNDRSDDRVNTESSRQIILRMSAFPRKNRLVGGHRPLDSRI